MATRLEISQVSKCYTKGVSVLHNLSLTVEPGELFFLLGPSGCGKSTLLRILAGLINQDSGCIKFDSIDVSSMPAEKRRAPMVFQNYALWPHLTVFENIAFGLKIAKLEKKEIERRVMEALDVVRLPECRDRKIPSLSGGQQQRVALARALAVNPAILLLDEPLSNLDARLRDTMRCEIRRICRERGLTAVYVTHDRQEALSIGDRLAVMYQGKIRQLGTPEELYERPIDRFCAEFLGDMNFIQGEVLDKGSAATDIGNFAVALNDFAVGEKVELAIRPERIHFVSNSNDGLEAVIKQRTFLGETSEWLLECGNVELKVREGAPLHRKIGEKCRVVPDVEHLIAFRK